MSLWLKDDIAVPTEFILFPPINRAQNETLTVFVVDSDFRAYRNLTWLFDHE